MFRIFLFLCLYLFFKNVFLFCIVAGHIRYKDSGHKFQLWSVKAAELGITEKDLMTWWKNQRSKHGRLTRSVGASGSGRKDDSEEDKWCRRRLQFLGRFIGRTHSRGGVDVSYKLVAIFICH